MDANNRSNTYWAALEAREAVAEIQKKIDDYYTHLQTTGKMRMWKRVYEYYYKPLIKGGKLTKSGDVDEYTNITIPHFRNLLLHLKTFTTSQRPAFESKASNTDVKSQAQTILSNCLLDYYMREKKLEKYIDTAVEYALLFAEGFIYCPWNQNLGKEYGVDETIGTVIYDGDIDYQVFNPTDIIRDYLKDNSNSDDWKCIRTFKNRYTLAASYSDLKDKILAIPSKVDGWKDSRISLNIDKETDDIPAYVFLHKPTSALPNGRVIEFLDAETILIDSPIPYNDIPVYRIAPEELLGTPFGYTVAYDLCAVQEAIDGEYSTVLTNHTAFGVQNICSPRGSNCSATQLAGGMQLIEYDPKIGKPEPLNLTNTPPEIFNFIQMLERVSETLSGVNSTARGNPNESLKSGSALALVQAQALQFSQHLQSSYASLLEDVGTSTIDTLKLFVTTPRVATIVGKNNRWNMEDFTGDDLKYVSRVTVDMGSPLTRTTAGRVQMAENLMQNKLIDNADQYIQVLTTGRLEPIIEGKQAEMLLIRAENEMFAEGKETPVIITDQHSEHILEHKTVLASPEARLDANIVKAVTNHIQQHVNFLKTADPILLSLIHQQPAPGNIGQPQQGMPNAGTIPANVNATNPLNQEAAKVNLPKVPQAPQIPGQQ